MELNFRRKIATVLSPKDHKNPYSLMYWREKIFYGILLGVSVGGTLTLIPSIISCWEDGLYIQIVIDVVVLLLMFFFLFNTSISYKIKSNIFLLFIYLLAVSLIITKGPYASGFIYLVGLSVIASAWRGTKVAVFTILINLVTITIIAVLTYNQVIEIAGFSSYNLIKWISLETNLFLANGLSAVSVGLLLDGLERTLNRSNRLKDELRIERLNLIKANQKAIEADRLKTAFLGNMSHELRTPLNTIIGFSDLIIQEKIQELPVIYEYQKIINEGGNMLLDLVNDILDISIIESGQLKIDKKTVQLKEIIEEISNTFDERLMMDLKPAIKFKIVDKLKDEKFSMKTDPLRLKQVAINLIRNSIKFTDSGEIIFSYGLNKDGKSLLFEVKDTGVGIPKEKQAEIFNRFSKLKNSSNNPIKGTGLGLAISKEIVELLGGNIWLESLRGEGTVFYFTIDLCLDEVTLLADSPAIVMQG